MQPDRAWPLARPYERDPFGLEEEVEIPVQVNGKLRGRIIVPADSPQELILERALADPKVQAAIAGKQIVKKIVVPGKLVSIVVR